jgi:DNA-binding winged helix-turn-helix (wHTH) protein/predicted Zn-dependent protease
MVKSKAWRFGGFVYNPSSGLRRGAEAVHLARKERALLELLLRANGTLVSKDQLVRNVWGDGAVSDESLSRCVYTLRRALHRSDGQEVVKTVYGGGLRICVPVLEGKEDTRDDPLVCPSTTSEEALRLWRMGWEQAGDRSRGGLERAQVTFRRAYEQDPTSLTIPLTIIVCGISQLNRGYLTSRAAAEAADEIIARVLKQAPRYPPVIACQAYYRAVVDRQMFAALAELDWAVQAMPHDYHAGFCRAWILSGMGRLDEAVHETERVVRTASPERGHAAAHAWMLFCARRFDDALSYAQDALRDRPENDLMHAVISSIHAVQGNSGEAIDAAMRAIEFSNDEPVTEAPLAYAYAVAGESNAALAVMRKLERRNDRTGPSFVKAPVWLALGDRERAMAALRDSDDRREPLFFYAQHDPRLAALGPLPPIRDASQVD